MKTIGLLGGTGWSSTIDYYRLLNEEVGRRLGGYHSANIVLKSIDYHEIMSNYGRDHNRVKNALKHELSGLIALNPDCFMICCNSLHKYYELIKDDLNTQVPMMHGIHLVSEECQRQGYKKVLLLATKFTMEDGFFENILRQKGIDITIPDENERIKMAEIHDELMENRITDAAKAFFKGLLQKYEKLDAYVLGCTEYPLVIEANKSPLPLINPVYLQVNAAIDFALS